MTHALCRPCQQITTLDVLWGIVLLGLLIEQAFVSLATPQPVYTLTYQSSDLPVQFIVRLLVSGQFERMGSFLVGLSLYRCGRQVSQAGDGLGGLDVQRIIRRLLMGMLGIGLGLSILRWSVDLLVDYAGLGFTLLYFRKQSVVSLLWWLVGVAWLAIGLSSGIRLLYPTGKIAQTQGCWNYLSYELMMLGGLLAGKLAIAYREPSLRVRLSLLQVGLWPAAFVLKGAWVVLSLGLVVLPQRLTAYQPVLLALCGFLGPSLLTGVYILDVGVNARLTPTGWINWIGRVGQLSLTNYVLQSVLYPLLLSRWELMGGSSLSIYARVGIVMSLFIIQLSFSRVWQKHYRQGPLEWLCRHWLLGKWAPPNSLTIAKSQTR